MEITKEQIITAVCEACGIESDDLKKKSRKEPIPAARALVAHFMYRELRMKPQDIIPLIGHDGCKREGIYHYVGKETLVEVRSRFQPILRHKAMQISQVLSQITEKASGNEFCK